MDKKSDNGRFTFRLNFTQVVLSIIGFLVASLIGILLYVWNDEVQARKDFQTSITDVTKVNASKSNANEIYIEVITDFIHEKYGVEIHESVWRRMYIETERNRGSEVSGIVDDRQDAYVPSPFIDTDYKTYLTSRK